MRTNIAIDDKLMQDALRASFSSTKRESLAVLDRLDTADAATQVR